MRLKLRASNNMHHGSHPPTRRVHLACQAATQTRRKQGAVRGYFCVEVPTSDLVYGPYSTGSMCQDGKDWAFLKEPVQLLLYGR